MLTHTTIDYVGAWATLGTAVGTLVLAAATFGLALKTRALAKSGKATADASESTAAAAQRELELLGDQTEAAKRQGEAAEAALSASVRPLLIDVPVHTMRTIQVQEQPGETHPATLDISVIAASVFEDTRTAQLTVPVRNVGSGVARGVAAAVTVAGKDVVGSAIARGTAPSVIAAGESNWIWFEDTAGPASSAAQTPLVGLLRTEEDLVVEVAYCDAAGRQIAASSLYLTKSGRTDRSYRVREVDPGHACRLTTDGT